MATDSIADIEWTTARVAARVNDLMAENAELRLEAEQCRQALIEEQAKAARLERELELGCPACRLQLPQPVRTLD